MKNILLPTDFSENSWNAITYAIKFYGEQSCNFYLLHVNRISHIVTGDIYGSTEDIIEKIYTKPAKRQLNEFKIRIINRFPNNKHKFYSLTDYNFFIESIRKYVHEKKIDIIVMGTKGASGLNQYIVGTNTGDVITKVRCTTLVVPEKANYTRVKEIAFPSDYLLTYNIQILKPLFDILIRHKASLKILHIGKRQDHLSHEQIKNMELLKDYFNNHTPHFYFLSNNKIEDAVQCFVQSRNIDMICMVAKNLNYFQKILFHSKVEEISYHAELPFLVLHE